MLMASLLASAPAKALKKRDAHIWTLVAKKPVFCLVTDHAGSRTACVWSTGEFSLLALLAGAIVYIVWQRRKTRRYRFALRPRKSGVWRPTRSARGFLLAQW